MKLRRYNFGVGLIILSMLFRVNVAAQQHPFPGDGDGLSMAAKWQASRFCLKPLNPDDPKGLQLGPGVPRVIDTNGCVVGMDFGFTTKQYRQAAIRLMVQEANKVAIEMQLSEDIPITVSNLTEAYVGPFGLNYRERSIGSITTANYVYCFAEDNKFNQLDVANYDHVCLGLERQKVANIEMNTNAAYRLAKRFLESAAMNVMRLNLNCTVHIAVSPYWNGLARLGQAPAGDFVPIYYVWWTSAENDVEGHGAVAAVELYLPTKKLLQLSVEQPQYIMRNPLVFKNLASPFPGKALITVFTNYSIFSNGPDVSGWPR